MSLILMAKTNSGYNIFNEKTNSGLNNANFDEVDIGAINISSNVIKTTTTNTDLNLNSNGTGSVFIDGASVSLTGSISLGNFTFSGNDTSVSNTDGDFNISSNGDGDINLTTPGVGSTIINTVDINAGTIDGTDITVGAGKTLDVSAGTLTLADDQISGDKVEGGTINSIKINTVDIDAGTIDGTDITVGAGKTLDVSAGVFSYDHTIIGAVTYVTDDAVTGLSISSNDIIADGTDTNIDINLTPKGTGNISSTGDIVLNNNKILLRAPNDTKQSLGWDTSIDGPLLQGFAGVDLHVNEVSKIKILGNSITNSTPTLITDTTESSSSTTGALIVSGGAGIAKNLHVGGTIYGDTNIGAGKTLDVSSGTLTIADNQISGDKVEGGTINAITINNLTSFDTKNYFGGDLVNPSIHLLSYSKDNVAITLDGYFSGGWKASDTTCARLYKNQDKLSFDYSYGNTPGTGMINTSSAISINLTNGLTTIENIDVTDTSTLGGIVSVTDTTDSSSTSTGSLILSGGLGIAKNLNANGTITATGGLLNTSGLDATGFESWTDTGDYYSISSTDITITRGGSGYISGKKITWSSGSSVSTTQSTINYIYINSSGVVTCSVSYTTALTGIILFSVWRDPNDVMVVVQENHNHKLGNYNAKILHDIGLHGFNANNTSGATIVAGTTTSELDISGTNYWYDEDIITTVAAASDITMIQVFYNGTYWEVDSTSTDIVQKYNNSGTATALTTEYYTGWRIMAGKSDLNSTTPKYFAIMSTSQYDNSAAVESDIDDNDLPLPTNELKDLELIQLGFIIVKEGTGITTIEESKTFVGSVSISTSTGGAVTDASNVNTVTTGFSNILSSADNTVQKALDTIDDCLANPPAIGNTTPATGTFTTCAATTFDTNVTAAGVTLTGTTLEADGTDTNIDINLTPKGTGQLKTDKVTVISNTTDSTTITSGALIVSGGVGIAKNTSVNGDIFLNDNTIYLRGSDDSNHAISWNASNDGPEITGNVSIPSLSILDWYTKGSWTAGLSGVTINNIIRNDNRYIKMGNVCVCTFDVYFSSCASVTPLDPIVITGLPFDHDWKSHGTGQITGGLVDPHGVCFLTSESSSQTFSFITHYSDTIIAITANRVVDVIYPAVPINLDVIATGTITLMGC